MKFKNQIFNGYIRDKQIVQMFQKYIFREDLHVTSFMNINRQIQMHKNKCIRINHQGQTTYIILYIYYFCIYLKISIFL